jgi:uncharacterized protein with NRDE domain
MCVIYVAYRRHPKYRLLLLANRDEFYDRPTAPAGRWKDFPAITAGRDLVAGGTWLGVTDSGRFAAVTNYRDPNSAKGSVSRGSLVAEFLKSSQPAAEYLTDVAANAQSYSGFNLLAGEVSSAKRELYYYSNRGDGVQCLAPGIYGLSNHLLNTPWPKVETGISRFTKLVENAETSKTAFFDLLSDKTHAADEVLPDTGVGFEREKLLSPIFIRTEVYGTRCSTVLTIDNDLKVGFEEKVFV